MSDRGGSGDFLAGFFFGAFVGAAVALLFAPERGQEVREQIREKGIELQQLAQDFKADPARFAEDAERCSRSSASAFSRPLMRGVAQRHAKRTSCCLTWAAASLRKRSISARSTPS